MIKSKGLAVLDYSAYILGGEKRSCATRSTPIQDLYINTPQYACIVFLFSSLFLYPLHNFAMRSLFVFVTKHQHIDTSSMKSPKWLNRIRRRSSSSTTSHHVEQQNATAPEHTISFEEEIQQLAHAYEFALDELAYAVESQGSIYYDGDRETAQEAFDSCIDRYLYLMERLSEADCVKLDALYRRELESLNTRLAELPPISSY